MTSLTSPTTFDFNAADIGGHILSDVTLPRPYGTSVVLRAVALSGSREGLAISAAENGAWELWHVPSGCCLMRLEGLRGLTSLFSAMGRTFSYDANWTAPSVMTLNGPALESLKRLRAYFS